METKSSDGKFISSVKVGPKGQIVIPKEVRQSFHISPGDTLILVADVEKGIAIERYSVFSRIADAILDGRARELYPEHTQEESDRFANYIKEMKEEK